MGIKVIARNKRASYDYDLLEKVEAGLILVGTEVKSIRAGKVKIAESHVTIDSNNEAWINNMYIAHYDFGNINKHEETRKRKLLLNFKEIEKIQHKMKAERLTAVPTIIYFKGNCIKIELAIGRGKKLHDKRDADKQKDIEKKLKRGIYE